MACLYMSITELMSTITDALALHSAPFGQGNGSIIETVSCSGSELRVVDCPISDSVDSYSCTHTEDAGVRCCK